MGKTRIVNIDTSRKSVFRANKKEENYFHKIPPRVLKSFTLFTRASNWLQNDEYEMLRLHNYECTLQTKQKQVLY